MWSVSHADVSLWSLQTDAVVVNTTLRLKYKRQSQLLLNSDIVYNRFFFYLGKKNTLKLYHLDELGTSCISVMIVNPYFILSYLSGLDFVIPIY